MDTMYLGRREMKKCKYIEGFSAAVDPADQGTMPGCWTSRVRVGRLHKRHVPENGIAKPAFCPTQVIPRSAEYGSKGLGYPGSSRRRRKEQGNLAHAKLASCRNNKME